MKFMFLSLILANCTLFSFNSFSNSDLVLVVQPSTEWDESHQDGEWKYLQPKLLIKKALRDMRLYKCRAVKLVTRGHISIYFLGEVGQTIGWRLTLSFWGWFSRLHLPLHELVRVRLLQLLLAQWVSARSNFHAQGTLVKTDIKVATDVRL